MDYRGFGHSSNFLKMKALELKWRRIWNLLLRGVSMTYEACFTKLFRLHLQGKVSLNCAFVCLTIGQIISTIKIAFLKDSTLFLSKFARAMVCFTTCIFFLKWSTTICQPWFMQEAKYQINFSELAEKKKVDCCMRTSSSVFANWNCKKVIFLHHR